MAATTTCCRGHAAVGMPPPPLFELDLEQRRRCPGLGLCTEGLGSESSESSGGDVDLVGGAADDGASDDTDVVGDHALPCKRQHRLDDDDDQTAAAWPLPAWTRRAFPPPISVIGAGGKPWLYLRPHREDGRLVLREVRIPSRELLQACREEGRFKLHFAHPEEQQQQQEQLLLAADDPDPADAMLQE
ncbi:protein FAF-like, chloroplastic [Oryza brachyantha]|uniref:FAF domain-containing protein n=1 Tax=Oryza brachyantha TaxID=4533 RepID=J3LDH9_ORYBR|nr:protein FAF-like, chloroplastic [Oryza brachyantha]XP_015689594.1 protein FAF-like, chloroplastic [Oryza brachyantha]XP_015689595.1 protein FAF-like, chloroplastic [Oryza brachyantha]